MQTTTTASYSRVLESFCRMDSESTTNCYAMHFQNLKQTKLSCHTTVFITFCVRLTAFESWCLVQQLQSAFWLRFLQNSLITYFLSVHSRSRFKLQNWHCNALVGKRILCWNPLSKKKLRISLEHSPSVLSGMLMKWNKSKEIVCARVKSNFVRYDTIHWQCCGSATTPHPINLLVFIAFWSIHDKDDLPSFKGPLASVFKRD